MNSKTLEKIRNSKILGFTKYDIFKGLTEKKIINMSRSTFYRQLLTDSELKEEIYTLIFDSLSSVKQNIYMLLNSVDKNELIQVSKYILTKYENKTENDYINILQQNNHIIDTVIDSKAIVNDDTRDIELFEKIQRKKDIS